MTNRTTVLHPPQKGRAVYGRNKLRPSVRSMSMPASSSVQVWEADLRAGFLPQVSPLSGAAASVRRKLTYRTAPRWTLVVIVIGILLGVGWIPGVVIRSAVQRSASGYLFVTADESRRMILLG